MTVIEKFALLNEGTGRSQFEPGMGQGDATLSNYVMRIWRHRRLIFGTVVLLTALAIVLVYQITPRYRSQTLVMINPPKIKVANIASVISGTPHDQDTINSEIAIINSRKLANRVTKKLNLHLDPEFSPKSRSDLSLVTWIRSLTGRAPAPKLSPKDQEEHARQRAVDSLQRALSVRPISRSRVIQIGISSIDPKKAGLIANTVADLYLTEQLEAKFEATRRASRWLRDRLRQLRGVVERSEQEVEVYRKIHGLIKGKDDLTVAAGQITELSNRLVAARAKRAEVEARLMQIERLVKSRGGVESAAEVLSSTLIQRLRERESTVIGKLAELAAEYGPKHPKMIAVRAELADLRLKIRAEVKKIVLRVRGEVSVALAREGSLARSLKQLEARVAVLNAKSVKLRALQREARANRVLLETVLSRFKETSAQQGIQSADARIISAAIVPTLPYYPNKMMVIGAVFFGSICLGFILAVLIEHLDAGFRSAEQVESASGVAALGLVPEIAGKRHFDGGRLRKYLREHPMSAYAESIRNIHIGLALSGVDDQPKTVLVTSAKPEEGKSTIAFSLAQIAVDMGKKAILVDCDLRRPVQQDIAGIERSPGLVELLAGQATLKNVVVSDPDSGLDILPAGEGAPNPADLLASKQMKQTLVRLREKYDLVVIDSPPVMAVSDSKILGPLVDRSLVVVRWAKTRRETAIHAARQVVDSGSTLAGVILSRVNVKRHAEYGFADSGSYYGKYSKYYSS